jgi:sugar lactone lactonase YvrE
MSVAMLAGCGVNGTLNYGTITTVAGDGTQGNAGDGGAATSAKLGGPSCVAVDGAGVLYIVDTTNNDVRRVDGSGNISTYAGTGAAGYSGDNGAAALAELSGPTGCALDSAGDLYIADSGNSVVREISTKGVITTVAGDGTAGFLGDGGGAISAELNQPYGVALDGSGNLYIADTLNYRVRKVDSTGTITTIAGNGTRGYSGDGAAATSAELYNPEGLVLDSAGDLYIADQANNVVREIVSGNIKTIAGQQKDYGYGGDGRRATSAGFDGPTYLALDSAGNLYIADTGDQRIRAVNAAGEIHTVAGDGLQGYKGDGGKATSAELSHPQGIALDASGNMFVADTGNGAVRKISP